jgi:hypothetical protein
VVVLERQTGTEGAGVVAEVQRARRTIPSEYHLARCSEGCLGRR